MKTFDLKIQVKEIKGNCPVFKIGDYFQIQNGYLLKMGNLSAICTHALGSVFPYYVALSRGISAQELGLNKTEDKRAYVQCLDPCEMTGGGTVIFEIEVLT